jgi:hypothetical protein
VAGLTLAGAAVPVPLPVAAGLVGFFLFGVAVIAWFILTYGKSRRALSGVAASMGLVEVPPRKCAVGRHGVGSLVEPSSAAAGERYGVRVELMFRRHEKRTGGPEVTAVGVVGATPPGFGVHLARTESSMLRFVAAGVPFSGPLATTHCAQGPPADVETLLTLPMQSRILAFPREIRQLAVYHGSATLEWRQFETDRSVIEEAFRLGLACLQAASTRAAGTGSR